MLAALTTWPLVFSRLHYPNPGRTAEVAWHDGSSNLAWRIGGSSLPGVVYGSHAIQRCIGHSGMV